MGAISKTFSLLTFSVALAKLPDPSKCNFTLSFLALGDWGTTDDENHVSATGSAGKLDTRGFNAQLNIGKYMGEWASTYKFAKPSFILNHGDAFYWTGLNQTDPRWKTVFENVYSHPDLMVPWYGVMGNHDYGGGSGMCGGSGWNISEMCDNADQLEKAMNAKFLGQSKYVSPNKNRWRIPDHYYKFRYSLTDGTSVEVYNLDTNFAADKVAETCCQCQGSGVSCAESHRGTSNCVRGDVAQYDRCMLIFEKWWDESMSHLQKDLKASNATWKIVHNHYQMKHFSELQQFEVLEILKKGGVHLFIGGHEHNEGHLFEDGIHYIVNGGGGGAVPVTREPSNVWYENSFGFLAVRVSKYYLQLNFYNDQGRHMHCYNLPVDSSDVEDYWPFLCNPLPPLSSL